MTPLPTRTRARTELDTSKLVAAIAEVQATVDRMSMVKSTASASVASASAASMPDNLQAELREQMDDVVSEIRFLLRTSLYQWFAALRNARHLSSRDVLRHAANRSIITLGECERWLHYCDLLGFNSGLDLTTSDSDSLPRLSANDVRDFIEDANRLAKQLGQKMAEDPVYRFGSHE